MCDGRDDVLGSGCGVKKTVTIDTHRHACGGIHKCTCLLLFSSFFINSLHFIELWGIMGIVVGKNVDRCRYYSNIWGNQQYQLTYQQIHLRYKV